MNDHVKACKAGREQNAKKADEIRKIYEQGHQVVPVVIHANLSELEAFRIERKLISEYKGLTNLIPGQVSLKEREESRARWFLRKIIPFDIWCSLKNPAEFQKSLYWSVVQGFQEIAHA